MENMEASPSDLSSSADPPNPEYLNSSVLLAFSAANMALEHDLSDIRNWETTEKSTALDASRRTGDDEEEDDCDSMASEIDHLSSFQESVREELSEAEDCWRQSLSSFDQDLARDVEEIERYAALNEDEENANEVIGCDDVDQIQPEMVMRGANIGPEEVFIGPLKGRVLVCMKSGDDDTLSTEEDSLQLINSMSLDSIESSGGTEMEETCETRRPGPPTIDTQIPSRGSTTTNEPPLPESPMVAILSSDLLHKGHGSMSLALAADILASQIYSQQSLLSYWLNKQLAVRCESEKLSPTKTKTHWLLGVPLIGSASKGGEVWLMGDDSDWGTRTLLVEDETLDEMEAF
jgi:hypothetical protein